MAYRDTGTAWGFTVPQEGETDSAERVRDRVREVDAAIPTPDQRAQLTSRGRASDDVSDATYRRDEYLSAREGADVYVTSLHRHPSPDSVPKADSADRATSADRAGAADVASRLSPGFRVNGHLTDGNTDSQGGGDVEISLGDIADATRVFWGTYDSPSSDPSVPRAASLRRGDLYIRVQ